jgi:hypothetical protein
MITCGCVKAIGWTVGVASLAIGNLAFAQSSVHAPKSGDALRAQQRARQQAAQQLSDKAVLEPGRSIFEVDPYQASTKPQHSAVGRLGDRQTNETLVPAYAPLERVAGRIQTRVQLRINSRLDRFNALPPILSPFATAADQARVATARRH